MQQYWLLNYVPNTPDLITCQKSYTWDYTWSFCKGKDSLLRIKFFLGQRRVRMVGLTQQSTSIKYIKPISNDLKMLFYFADQVEQRRLSI
jgi:hypothetical protein